MSADIISETPKKKPMSPKSFAKDVVECLAIVTPSGRVDAAKLLSSKTESCNAVHCHVYLVYWLFYGWCNKQLCQYLCNLIVPVFV